MTEVRCEECGRVLAEVEGKIKIKCRKCGKWNYIDTNYIKVADQASQS